MLNERGEAVFKGSIETKQNCKISGELRVGLKGSRTETGISFYGDAMASDSKLYGRFVPYGLGDVNEEEKYGINITDGLLYEDGKRVLTVNDYAALQGQINSMQSEIKTLKEQIRDLINP